MSGRSYPNNVNGRGNGAAGRGGSNSPSYGASAVPGTSSAQYYPSSPAPNMGQPYPVGARMTTQYYGPNVPMVGMWQPSAPTGSAAASNPAGTPSTAIPTGTAPYPHTPIHAIPNQAPYMQAYRHPIPQQLWTYPQGATYMTPMITSPSPPNASYPLPTAPAGTVPAPRQRKISTITDKHGKPLDLTVSKPTQAPTASEAHIHVSSHASSSTADTNPVTNTQSQSVPSHDAGMKLREAAERAIIESGGSLPVKRKETEAKLKEESDKIQRQREEEEAAARKEAQELETKLAEERRKKEEEELLLAAIQREQEEKARLEAEEKARLEAEEKARLEAEEKARAEAEERAKLEAEESARLKRETNNTSLSSLAARVQMHQLEDNRSSRKLYSKAELLKFRDLAICCHRPADLPEMNVNSTMSSNRRASGQWARESNKPIPSPQVGVGKGESSNRRQTSSGSMNSFSTPEQWARGMTMQKNTPAGRGGRGGRGDKGSMGSYQQELDGPVPTLKRSENRWVPVKDTSALVVTEKTVKSILNKMTKEKFEKLSDQMCGIKIVSYEILTMMINHIYEKAIYETTFSDMYAELCVKLSHSAKNNTFVQIIESDEEPPTDDGLDGNGQISSGNTVYRWSNDVNTDDSEIMGPFESPEECISCALDTDNCPKPCSRGEMELELFKLRIHHGMFIKIMRPKNDPSIYYTVFFPMSKVEEVGQQVSKELYLSDVECKKDGKKQNSFRRILLYKCEDEFNKKDIYENWKKEKKVHEETKSSLSDSERLEKDGELEFRRMKIKKQMLGNIKFIGELFKKEMLKEEIMHYCIQQLLKIQESNGELTVIKDDEMDEEDHEALCNLFASIGSEVDNNSSKNRMQFYFRRIAALSTDKNLSSRSRFMYKDLLELKDNKWKARREEETAKTLDEIKKDFEREERLAAQQSQQIQSRPTPGNLNRNTSSSSRASVRGTGVSNYGDSRDDSRRENGESRVRQKSVKDHRDSRSVIKSDDIHHPQILTRPNVSAPAQNKDMLEKSTNDKKTITPEERIAKKAIYLRSEFVSSGGQLPEEEILFIYEDIIGLPDAGRSFVQNYADTGVDCKQDHRDAIIMILSVLITHGKLKPDDFHDPCRQLIEYLSDFVIDNPNAIQDIGDMIAAFIDVGALSFSWLCEQCESLKDEPCAVLFPKLINTVVDRVSKKYGENKKSSFKVALEPHESRLSHLVGESEWKIATDKWR